MKNIVFEVSGSPRCGQVGPSSAQDGPKLGLSWHLDAILVPRWPKMAKMTFKMRLQSAKMRFCRPLGGLWSGPGGVFKGSWAVNFCQWRVRVDGLAGPVKDFVLEVCRLKVT